MKISFMRVCHTKPKSYAFMFSMLFQKFIADHQYSFPLRSPIFTYLFVLFYGSNFDTDYYDLKGLKETPVVLDLDWLNFNYI